MSYLTVLFWERNEFLDVTVMFFLPSVSFFEANPEEKPAKQEKSSGFMKKIYISGIAVLILGVVIAIAMCASQPKNR